MKIAILNDTHCGIRNSSDIFFASLLDLTLNPINTAFEAFAKERSV